MASPLPVFFGPTRGRCAYVGGTVNRMRSPGRRAAARRQPPLLGVANLGLPHDARALHRLFQVARPAELLGPPPVRHVEQEQDVVRVLRGSEDAAVGQARGRPRRLMGVVDGPPRPVVPETEWRTIMAPMAVLPSPLLPRRWPPAPP